MVEAAQRIDRERREAVIQQERARRARMSDAQRRAAHERDLAIAEASAFYAYDEGVRRRRREAIADAEAAFAAFE